MCENIEISRIAQSTTTYRSARFEAPNVADGALVNPAASVSYSQRGRISREGSRDPAAAAARVRPYKTCPRNYVVDTWRGEDKASHARLVKRTPPSAESQKRERGMIFASVGRFLPGTRRLSR